MGDSQRPVSRAERRRRSEARILAAARELFAERGYDRTTIRAVAGAAGVDPALVMRYFGDKEGLFRRAVLEPAEQPLTADPERLAELALDILGVKLGELPGEQPATLRAMLTHPETAAQVREALSRQIEQASTAIPGEDAELRAALILSTLLGVMVGKHLLRLRALRNATPEQLTSLLRPSFHALTGHAGSRATGAANPPDPDEEAGSGSRRG
jgi:AcrR family transcriptional regulator